MLQQNISHYRILNHLGTSLIGEVYLAEDTQLGRKVAVTLLSENFTRDNERMLRLSQEARAISALNHPNIRMIYEVGHDEPYHYIAKEFVEGPTLRVYLGYTRMSLDETLDAILQLVAGLAAAHAAGVLHRDLKPENIVMRPDGFVKILDFGLAQLVEQDSMLVDVGAAARPLTEPLVAPDEQTGNDTSDIHLEEGSSDPYQTKPLGRMLDSQRSSGLWWMPGTTGYLSPEQILGAPVDHRSDIFSLGVVLFEMCTGRLPFEGGSSTGMLSSILEDSPAPVGRFMHDAPEELEWIIARALAKNPDERYQTAREWLVDLKRLKQRLEFEAEQAKQDSRDSGGERVRSDRNRGFDTSRIKGGDSGRAGRESGRRSGRGTSHISHRSGRSGSARKTGDIVDSIAVLPLSNSGADPRIEYLSDGITEMIINSLSRLPGLRVMARSTVFRFKGREIDPLEIGHELDVRAVFVGRLLQRGDKIVIKAELVDAIDGALLWTEKYEREAGDVFELEADVAKQISEHLRIKITGEQQEGLAKRYTDNPEAYELYLRGRYFWNQRSLEGMKKGVESFVQAIRKDSGFALAYAGLADCYMMLSIYSLPPREFVPKARISVTRALELDPLLAEAHASLGFLAFWYDWDFLRAEQEYKRAIEINPNYSEAHQWMAYLLAAQERFDEALAGMLHAQKLDPLSIAIPTNTAELLYRAGRYDDAVAECGKALEMDPQFAKALYWRVMAWMAGGKLTEALSFLELAMLMQGENRMIVSTLYAAALARAGRREEALKTADKLLQHAEEQYIPPFYFAVVYASLEDKDQAFAFLEKAYQERSGWMPWLKLEPLFADLRTDARFSDLLRRIGVKP